YDTFLLERDRTHPATADESAPADRPASPVHIASMQICDAAGAERRIFARGDDVHIRLRVESDNPSQPVHILVGVNRVADDLQCFAVGTHGDGVPPMSGSREYDVQLQLIDVQLLRGD